MSFWPLSAVSPHSSHSLASHWILQGGVHIKAVIIIIRFTINFIYSFLGSMLTCDKERIPRLKPLKAWLSTNLTSFQDDYPRYFVPAMESLLIRISAVSQTSMLVRTHLHSIVTTFWITEVVWTQIFGGVKQGALYKFPKETDTKWGYLEQI